MSGSTRLGDLLPRRAQLAVWCQACGHHRVLASQPLARRFGAEIALPDLARHLVCGRCGGRRVECRPHYRGLGVVANHRPRPPPDEP